LAQIRGRQINGFLEIVIVDIVVVIVVASTVIVKEVVPAFLLLNILL